MGSLLSSCLKDEWTYNDDEAGEDGSKDGEFTKFMSDDGLRDLLLTLLSHQLLKISPFFSLFTVRVIVVG